MTQIYQQYKGQVEFFVVYVQEAHPTDGWQTDSNIQEGVLFRQHQSYEEREEVAQSCSLDLHIGLPILIEEIDNAIDEAYGAAPERLYLVGKDGKVAYHGGAGPHFFDLDEWKQAIEACVEVEANP
ncbi:Thyroxine 5-deiodinase [Geodia barretti]|uniref:Iodothyronine deiodinase n=1 Tax=Geodia barretti TaxID=519541 RepID=A0AA35S5Z4_GEOBA|nr:Thyroxine 5-deiodinase [Geodia barretti]